MVNTLGNEGIENNMKNIKNCGGTKNIIKSIMKGGTNSFNLDVYCFFIVIIQVSIQILIFFILIVSILISIL